VYRALFGLLGSREASEDLAQETFLALLSSPPRRSRSSSRASLSVASISRPAASTIGQLRVRFPITIHRSVRFCDSSIRMVYCLT
jgi:hypothetical protein